MFVKLDCISTNIEFTVLFKGLAFVCQLVYFFSSLEINSVKIYSF